MRTCPNCGCYVPDKWITCPACDARVAPVFTKKKTEQTPRKDGAHYVEEKLYKDGVVTIYRVDEQYDYKRIKTCSYWR